MPGLGNVKGTVLLDAPGPVNGLADGPKYGAGRPEQPDDGSYSKNSSKPYNVPDIPLHKPCCAGEISGNEIQEILLQRFGAEEYPGNCQEAQKQRKQ
jgi:hypothetical protein